MVVAEVFAALDRACYSTWDSKVNRQFGGKRKALDRRRYNSARSRFRDHIHNVVLFYRMNSTDITSWRWTVHHLQSHRPQANETLPSRKRSTIIEIWKDGSHSTNSFTGASGVMETKVNFCAVNGDIAVLRADYQICHEGEVIIAGSAVEVARRQPDGRWLYIIDNATGASAPSAWESEAKKANS